MTVSPDRSRVFSELPDERTTAYSSPVYSTSTGLNTAFAPDTQYTPVTLTSFVISSPVSSSFSVAV